MKGGGDQRSQRSPDSSCDSPVDMGLHSPLKTAKIKPKLGAAIATIPTKLQIRQ